MLVISLHYSKKLRYSDVAGTEIYEYNKDPEIHKIVAELLKLWSMLKSFVFVFKTQNRTKLF